MTKNTGRSVLAALCATLSALLVLPTLSASAAGKKMTVTGDVLDSACLFTQDLHKPISNQCALECAAGGSPLVILGRDGVVYWPIDNKIPAQGQNHRLIKFAGQSVKMSGEVFERGGSRAIVIATIEETK